MAGIHTPERRAAQAEAIRAAHAAGRYASLPSWSDERRARFGAAIKAAHTRGSYAKNGAAIAAAHAEGRYAGVGAKIQASLIRNGTEAVRRKKISETLIRRAERLRANSPVRPKPLKMKPAPADDSYHVKARAVMQRMRARRKLVAQGLPVPAHLQSQRVRASAWDKKALKLAAGARVAAMLAAQSPAARLTGTRGFDGISSIVVKQHHATDFLWARSGSAGSQQPIETSL